MRVIKYNNIKTAEIACSSCGAELEVELSDCKETRFQNVLIVKCCVCGNPMVLHREMFISRE